MASFYIYETKTIPLWLRSLSGGKGVLSDVHQLIITLEQNRTVIINKDLSSPDVEMDVANDMVKLYLTQEETARFKPGMAVIQVNILYEDKERDVSAKGKINVLDNAYREVMLYG